MSLAPRNVGKVIIADDHPLFRTALREAVQRRIGTPVFVEAGDFQALSDALQAHPDVDLVLLDLHMPGSNGFSELVYLSSRHPEIPVVMVSANDDPLIIHRAMDHGAAGFIPKSASVDQIGEAIQVVLRGDNWIPPDIGGSDGIRGASDSELALAQRIAELTPQQFRVLGMLAQGMLNKQIAYDLDVSEATIKAHVTAIMRKLQVSNRTQAVLAAASLGAVNTDTRTVSGDS